MTELMWNVLTGTSEQPQSPDQVSVHWLYAERHKLHLPSGTQEGEVPVYNSYAKAFYVVNDLALKPVIETHLEQLETAQQDALALSGTRKISRHLQYPDYRPNVTAAFYKRLTGFSSRRQTQKQVLRLIDNVILETRTLTAFTLEPYAQERDALLDEQYAFIQELEQLRREVAAFEGDTLFRLRQPFRRVRPMLHADDGSSEQLHLKNVGLILLAPVELRDETSRPVKARDTRSPAPLAINSKFSLYLETQWQTSTISP